jgi:hypothetical protein
MCSINIIGRFPFLIVWSLARRQHDVVSSKPRTRKIYKNSELVNFQRRRADPLSVKQNAAAVKKCLLDRGKGCGGARKQGQLDHFLYCIIIVLLYFFVLFLNFENYILLTNMCSGTEHEHIIFVFYS